MKTITLNPALVNETTYPNIYQMASGFGIIRDSDNHKRLINYPQAITPNQVEAVAKIYNDLFNQTETKLQQLTKDDDDLNELLYEGFEDAFSNFSSEILDLAYHAGLTL